MKRMYLDYAATTPVDPAVALAMQPYFSRTFGNPGSLHVWGQAASRAVYAARRSVAGAIGARADEIIFTGSATEANNLAVAGALRAYPKRAGVRPRIIVSAAEHESVLEAARSAGARGADTVIIPVSRTGRVQVAKLKAALSRETVLVSVMCANNEVGTIQPVAEVAKAVHEFRTQSGSPYPLLHTDAVQAFQYIDCGVAVLGVDLMTLSAHKIYGPKGVGALYVRKNKKVKNGDQKSERGYLEPIIVGGGQEAGLRSGTENVPALVGFGRAAERCVAVREREARRVQALAETLFKGLRRAVRGISLNGEEFTSGRRLPNSVHIYTPGVKASELLVALDIGGVSASMGSACAARAGEPSHVLRAMGFGEKRARESVRFTLGRPTTRAEVVRATRTISRAIAGQRSNHAV